MMSAEEILAALADIRAKLPHVQAVAPPPPAAPERASMGAEEAMLDFEGQSIAMAAEAMAAELRAALVEAEAKVLSEALAVYYAAEELARDPAHADLIPQVEAMRAAYERDYGSEIPPRAEAKRAPAAPLERRTAE
jgi:hypothetical protein